MTFSNRCSATPASTGPVSDTSRRAPRTSGGDGKGSLRVHPVAPREELPPVFDPPVGPLEAEGELGEAHLHVGLGILATNRSRSSGSTPDRPLDRPPGRALSAHQPPQRRDCRLELRGPLRERGVPGVGVAGDEPQGPTARCRR